MTLKELGQKANEQIKRIKDWYSENSEAFDYMDLKLHDVSYYCYSKMEDDFPLCKANDRNDEYSYFCMFCEDEYRAMEETLGDQYRIDFKDFHYQLGRTSSFYLHDQEIFQFESHKINWNWTLNGIVYELYNSNGSYLVFDTEGNIDVNKSIEDLEVYMDREGAEERVINELKWFATEMYDEVLKHFEDMFKVYEYIKDFKNNQVEIFKEWIEYYEDELAEEKRKEEEYEAKRQNLIARFENSVLREILNKYVHNNDAIENLLQSM